MKRPTWGIPLGKKIKGMWNPYNRMKTKSDGIEYTKTYEIVDSEKMTLRKGDVFQFRTSIPNKFPNYAVGEFAVILERYKITKFKNHTYNDYGSVVMMLTGKKKGHIFKVQSAKISVSERLTF